MTISRRRWTQLFAAITTLVVVTAILSFRLGDTLELHLRDVVLRLMPAKAASATVVVAIDEQSIREIGPWPWPRRLIAQLIDRAALAGARAVVLDLLLAEPREGDDVLAQAMRRVPTIAVSVLDEHGEWLGPAPLLRNAATLAHGNFELDQDGILRRFAATKQSRDRSLTALSVEAASMRTSAPVPVGRTLAPSFRTAPRSIPLVSAVTLLRGTLPNLRDKIVFLGPTAWALGDRVLTPVSRLPDPGVTVHAAATESLVRGEEIREMPPVVAGGFAALSVLCIVSARRTRTAAAVLGSIVVAGSILLLATIQLAVPFVILMACVAVPAAAVEAAHMAGALRQSDATVSRLTRHRESEAESKRLLAHELKTPLASMRGLSQLLAGFDLTDAERRRVASLLESEAGKLQAMVHALLDLERLPLRDFESSSSVFDLGEVVGRRVEFLRASSDHALNMSSSPGVFVRGDPALIERVVDNLVGNALKYAPGPVTVRVGESGAGAAFEVEDEGAGIAEGERERIFDRFFRGATAGGTQGLGLGLSLVAEVARWHGGKVSAQAGARGGSLFRFVLPSTHSMAKAGAM